jgi:hypothetical protein
MGVPRPGAAGKVTNGAMQTLPFQAHGAIFCLTRCNASFIAVPTQKDKNGQISVNLAIFIVQKNI